MALNIQWQWTCDVCGERTDFDHGGLAPEFTVIRYWQIPAGWSWLDRKMVCPRHKIVIDPEGTDG